VGYPKFIKWRNIGEIPDESHLYWDGIYNYDNEDGANTHTRVNQIVVAGLFPHNPMARKLRGEEWFKKIYVDYTQNFLRYTDTWFEYSKDTTVVPQAGFCGIDHSVPLHRDSVFEPIDPILLALTDMKLFVHDTTYDISKGDVFSLATNLAHSVPKLDYDQKWVGVRFNTNAGRYNILHFVEIFKEYEELSEITYPTTT
jgi:hypothetical protein